MSCTMCSYYLQMFVKSWKEYTSKPEFHIIQSNDVPNLKA